ncbi:MobQ family relaxase [Priestia flexa]|uniref:MobQ family relaxase n=1 Tax=Priestia flexa TaxID=86664 RepID=UPI00077C56A2|nr:MobQ family relaxase [Priestia flexa]MED4587858.1 MobQ family relaxase [Priestia flexa]
MSKSSLHFSLNVISRKDGRSTVAAAAYRSDEKLYDEREGRNFQFKKHEVKPESFILAPDHAPKWVEDREKLWNEVEKIEKRWNSQLSREIVIALPNDLNNEQQKELIKNYAKSQFVEKGMVADVNIHRDKNHNPHAHIMLTMRPFNEDGTWGEKRPFSGQFDKDGKKIYLDNPWDNKENLGLWRDQYQDLVNKTYERLNLERRFDLRSYERQGREENATVHLGHIASAMEARAQKEAQEKGVEYKPVTNLGKLNEDIKNANAELKVHQKDLVETDSKIIDLKTKREKIQNDIRRTIEKSGVWNALTDKEKTSITFIRNRMKQEVNLTVALKCNEQFSNWEKALSNKSKQLIQEKNAIETAKKLYEEYKNAPQNTIAKDRAKYQVQRQGFSVESFDNQVKERIANFNKEANKFKSEKEKFLENRDNVKEAIKVLEAVTISQAKVLYNGDQRIKEMNPVEVDKLVQEFKTKGNIIPLDNAREFLDKSSFESKKGELSLVDQYDKLRKDNQFVINWHNSVKRKELELVQIKDTNPKEYQEKMNEFAQQKVQIAERFKKVKTSLSIVEKSMINEVKKQYPNEKWIDKMDGKTAAKVLRANQNEKRIIPINEFMKYLEKDNKQNVNGIDKALLDNRESVELSKNNFDAKVAQSNMMNTIANNLKGLIDDSDKGQKTNIDRELEASKRRNRNSGMSR